MTLSQIQAKHGLSNSNYSLALAAAGELNYRDSPGTPDWLRYGAGLEYEAKFTRLAAAVGAITASSVIEDLLALLAEPSPAPSGGGL